MSWKMESWLTMAIEMNSVSAICYRCGRQYTKRKGFFSVSYAIQYKGLGYMHICKQCVESMYASYLSQCKKPELAVRQMCRKLDLYWNKSIFEASIKKSSPRSVMSQYMTKINTSTFAGKSYDDTLTEEDILWNFELIAPVERECPPEVKEPVETIEVVEEEPDIPEEVIAFWGSGYSYEMYKELEQRRLYYISKLPKGTELDIGSEVLIRQICNLEVSIAKDSAAGKSIDKSVNSLNTLLGSLNLKPAQQKDNDMDADLTSTPLGVWLYRYENKRPLPEVDDQLKDVNHVKKYVFTWMGHLVKMLGIKNGYTKLYDEEIERLRVERPEYADEDDEDLLIDAYSDGEENG